MLRISKLTDYGTVVLANIAARSDTLCSASDVADATGIALPTVSKLLKSATRSGLLVSTRGAHGGYRLARPPQEISAADVIDAIEGPVSITECSGQESHCEHEDVCCVGGAWQQINQAIRNVLNDVSLAELMQAGNAARGKTFAGVPVRIEATLGKKA